MTFRPQFGAPKIVCSEADIPPCPLLVTPLDTCSQNPRKAMKAQHGRQILQISYPICKNTIISLLNMVFLMFYIHNNMKLFFLCDIVVLSNSCYFMI